LDNVDYARAPIKVYPPVTTATTTTTTQIILQNDFTDSLSSIPQSWHVKPPTAYLSYRKYKHHQRIMKIILPAFFFGSFV